MAAATTNTLTFVTDNPQKWAEVSKLLADFKRSLKQQTVSFPTSVFDDSMTFEEKTVAKAKYAFNAVKGPCFVEATCVYLENHGLWGVPTDGRSPLVRSESRAPPSVTEGLVRVESLQFAEMGMDAFSKRFEGEFGVARVMLAYTEDGHQVDVFEGEMEGSVVAPRGNAGFGWDRIWLLEGYSDTLSEMVNHKFLINYRWRPYLELAAKLRELNCKGIFEVHITVGSCNAEMEDLFVQTCKDNKCKPIMIELPKGDVRKQLMTSSYHRGDLKDVQRQAFELSQEFAKNGFTVARTKIEAAMSNSDIPQTDEEGERFSPPNYFEFHIKLALQKESGMETLRELCDRHDAHLSSNAFKKTQTGELRFVTQRMYKVGKNTAVARFNALVEDLELSGFSIACRLREYAVYDSNVKIDSGWIE